MFQAVITNAGSDFGPSALVGWLDQNFGDAFFFTTDRTSRVDGVDEMNAWDFYFAALGPPREALS